MLLFMVAARRMLLSNSFRIGFRPFNFKHAFRLKVYTTQQLGVLFGSLPLLDIVGNQSRLVCVRGKMKTGIMSTPILAKDTVIILKAVNNTTVDVGFSQSCLCYTHLICHHRGGVYAAWTELRNDDAVPVVARFSSFTHIKNKMPPHDHQDPQDAGTLIGANSADARP